ncbi:hypothetical protein [Pseudomonas syringae]|uniref:hypothetical protein n=1 Tax=Pseudomonas syringae TaxID=317 RepID=UPI0007EE3B18|nr:hypothetical protein [Pseudomonas syringae]OBS35398.1 hypothetical protein A9K81_08235 [Pseudomonas syringae pv. syringae]UZS62127.1 hypothetical protein OQB64_23535 [Pseudomonas syringae]
MDISNPAREQKQRLYERLYVAAEDLWLARQYTQHLLKKGWHSAPWERRGSIYMQQSAFVTALVVSYARAFTKSHGWPRLPESILPEDLGAIALHKQLMDLRHEVYAHSDSKHHKVQPWRIDSEALTDLRGAPSLRFTKDDCEQITELIDEIRKRLLPKIITMRAEIADA